MESVSQMNIRLDASTKKQGDSALQKIGYTPMKWIRLMWTFLAENKSNTQALREVERLINPSAEDADEKKARLMCTVESTPKYIEQELMALGISLSKDSARIPYNDLKQEALNAHFERKGLL